VGSGNAEVGKWKWEFGSGKWECGSGNAEVGSGKWEVGMRPSTSSGEAKSECGLRRAQARQSWKWEYGSGKAEFGRRNATSVDANMVPGAVLLVFKENAVVCHEVSKVADRVSCRWVTPETAFELPAPSKTTQKSRE
jgi:hypothetical protein